MNYADKKEPICVYDDYIILEDKEKHYVLDQEGIRELKVVTYLRKEEYEKLELAELLALCKEPYDLLGELDNYEEYYFWSIVESIENQLVKSDDARAIINNIITYAGDHFSGEDLYYFLRNILYDVIKL